MIVGGPCPGGSRRGHIQPGATHGNMEAQTGLGHRITRRIRCAVHDKGSDQNRSSSLRVPETVGAVDKVQDRAVPAGRQGGGDVRQACPHGHVAVRLYDAGGWRERNPQRVALRRPFQRLRAGVAQCVEFIRGDKGAAGEANGRRGGETKVADLPNTTQRGCAAQGICMASSLSWKCSRHPSSGQWSDGPTQQG